MKVILRLNTGITTKTINVPESCVRGEFRLPFKRAMTARMMGDIQDMGASMGAPYMIFRWDRKSVWGNKTAKEPILIMDLVDVSY